MVKEPHEQAFQEIQEAFAAVECSCWVKDQPDEERYSIRYGAHHLDCPVYRPSGDPLDNLRDAQLRMQVEARRAAEGLYKLARDLEDTADWICGTYAPDSKPHERD